MAAARQEQLDGVVVKMKSDKVHERALRLAYPYVGERMVLTVFPVPRPRHNGISSRWDPQHLAGKTLHSEGEDLFDLVSSGAWLGLSPLGTEVQFPHL